MANELGQVVSAVNELDNPMWHSLTGVQARFCSGSDRAKRYRADIAPFLAIAAGQPDTSRELAALAVQGEMFSLVGALPELTDHWELLNDGHLLQMVATQPIATAPQEHSIDVLTEADVPDMLALTARVFPGYFRQRTFELGKYLGVHVGDHLVAMAGERMHCGDYREISGVCTDTEFLGRGLARSLVSELMNAHFAKGLKPFLHVDLSNAGAIRLYEKLGFTRRAELPLLQVRRGPKAV